MPNNPKSRDFVYTSQYTFKYVQYIKHTEKIYKYILK